MNNTPFLLTSSKEEFSAFLKENIKVVIASSPFNSPPKEREILSQKNLAKRIDLSEAKLIQLRKAGKIRFFRIGNKIRYDLDEVLEDLRGTNELN